VQKHQRAIALLDVRHVDPARRLVARGARHLAALEHCNGALPGVATWNELLQRNELLQHGKTHCNRTSCCSAAIRASR
jgi:hypothetical protein